MLVVHMNNNNYNEKCRTCTYISCNNSASMSEYTFGGLTYFDSDVYSLLFQVAAISCFFISVQDKFKDSLKKQAWLIMLLLSIVLATSSIIYGLYVEFHGGYIVENVFSENIYSRAVVTFFAACNIADIIVGYFYYPSYCDPFTTYFHHFFYVSCCVVYIGYGQTLIFLLGFFVEIPTVLLNLGVVFPNMRTDLLYGIIFFIFRVVYHIIFTFRVAQIDESGFAWKLILVPFPAHILWFYKWLRGYMKKGSDILESDKRKAK